MFARKFDLKLILIAALGLTLAACAGRARRPITQPAQLPAGQTGTGSGTGGVTTDGLTPDQDKPSITPPGTDTDGGTGTDSGTATEPSTGTDSSVVTNTSSGTATSTSTSTGNQLIIPLKTEDNTTIQFEWDGQSFKGNDKFDLIRKP